MTGRTSRIRKKNLKLCCFLKNSDFVKKYFGKKGDFFLVILTFLVVFFFEKTTYCCRARRLSVCPSVRLSVCPSVRLSVRLSSVEIFSFRGNSLSSKPIDLKIGLNVREGVVHVRKA